MTRYLLLLGVLMVAACTPQLPVQNPSSGCEAKVVHAMTSPTPVAGAFACFDSHDPNMGAALAQAGITDDASLAAFAASDPAYTTYTRCQHKADGYSYYELHGADSSTQVMRLKVGSNGKVTAVAFRGVGSTCADA